jgi:plasmid stabilization system protein ParE
MILFSSEAISDVERVRNFLASRSPDAAKRALATLWGAIERVERFPGLGRPTEDPEIRQIVVRFGAAGYVVRYCVMPDDGTLLVLRIWHGREARR